MTNPSDVTRFLQAVFGKDHAQRAILANLHPSLHVRGDPSHLSPGRDCYWSVASFAPGARTNKDKGTGLVLDVRALVIDDVGTKISAAAVELALGSPTAVVETSAGNQQWSWRLEPPVAPADWPGFFAGVEALVNGGKALDGSDAVHLFRLPMGVNTKPGRGRFPVHMVALDPAVSLDSTSISRAVGGVPDLSAGKTNSEPPQRVRDIRGLVALLPNDEPYDGWIARGQQIKALALDEEEGREAFHEFSSRPEPSLHVAYDAEETERRWGTLTPERTRGQKLIDDVRRVAPLEHDLWAQGEAGGVFGDVDPDELAQIEVEARATQAARAAQMRGVVDFTVDQQRSARALLAALGGTVKQIDEDDWRQFDQVSGRWRKWPGNHMLRATEVAVEARKRSGAAISKGLATKLGTRAFIAGVASLAATSAEIIAVPGDFDAEPLLLGTPSGVVDLRPGGSRLVRQGRAGEMVSKATAVDPAPPGTPRPVWSKFLGEFTQGDAALEEWLQVYAGYSLTGLFDEHLMPFFHGSGGNGKGTYINTLIGIWGEYGCAVDKRLLFEKQGGGHLAPLAAMEGKRLGALMDVDPTAMWDMQMLKALTGGDIVKADHKYGAPFDFRAMTKLVVSGQSVPGIRTMDGGIARRLKIVTLMAKPRKINLGLQRDLVPEWGAILRWALDGLDLYWGMGGLPVTKSIAADTAAYVEDQDVFGKWVREKLVEDETATARMADLFRSWDAFRGLEGAYGAPPLGPAQLSRRLGEVGIKVLRDKKGSYVRMKAEKDQVF